VSEALRDPDPGAQERLQLLSAGWAGGTRIGECLEQFEREPHRCPSRTALIIVSDGYDTGEPTLLANVVPSPQTQSTTLGFGDIHWQQSDYYSRWRAECKRFLPELDLFAPPTISRALSAVLPRLVLALR